MRILLVDSSEDFLTGLTAWLEGETEIDIVGTAHTGIEAVEAVDRLRPDLVVMDVTMSRMNGFEATREIKAGERSPHVVLTTFHASETARREAKAAGADDLIAKAEVTEKLQSLIDDLVSGRDPVEGFRSNSLRRRSRPKEKGV
jgi:two-component system nitrate/nitrite response regulator NarL